MKNFELPDSSMGIMLLALIVSAVTVLFIVDSLEIHPAWFGIAIIPAIFILIVGLSHDEKNYIEYRAQYIDRLNGMQTHELVSCLEDKSLTEHTKEFVLGYLNKERPGWASDQT